MATNSNYVWNKLKNGLEESKDDIISNVVQQQETNNVHSAVASATGAIDKEAGLANAIDATFNSGSGSKNSIKGAPDDLVSTANSKFSQSDNVTATDSERSGALSNLSNLASKESILSSGVIKGLEKQFEVPSEVTQADAYLVQQLEKIQSGRTSYTDQVKEMMNKIMNREDFTYDVNTDPLFQQALSSAMNSGKQAMQDTIGQASALTGGYGSTYATTAGNQAYNSYIEDAYDNLPQYYQMALDAYNAEGEEMYQQFGMLSTLDEQEYNRNITAYDSTFQYRNQKYNEAYTQFRDYKSDLVSIGNLQLNEYGQRVNAASSYYNAIADYSDSMYSREYNSWLDSVNQATEMIKLYNNDYWEDTKLDFQATQNQLDRDLTISENALDREHDSSENALNREHQSSENALNREHESSENALNREHQSSENALDREHKSSENQKDRDLTTSENEKDRNLTATENAKDRELTVSENQKDREHDASEGALDRAVKVSSGGSGGSNKKNDDELKEPTETQMKNGLKAYEEGGMAGLNEYINSVPNTVDKETIAAYAGQYGELPYSERTYTVIDDGGNNWGWGIDNNAVVKDQYGNEFTLKELAEFDKEIAKELSDKKYTVGSTYKK